MFEYLRLCHHVSVFVSTCLCLGISVLSLSILWRQIRISNTPLPLPGDIYPVLVVRHTRLGNIYKGCLILVGKDTGLGAFGRQFEPYRLLRLHGGVLVCGLSCHIPYRPLCVPWPLRVFHILVLQLHV